MKRPDASSRKRRETGRPDEVPWVEAEVREEIDHYLELRAAELEADGVDPAEAMTRAREAFGDVESVVRHCRELRSRPRASGRRFVEVQAFTREIRQSARALARAPAFVAVVVLTLGLGVGSATAIFSVVDSALLRSLPFPRADELVDLTGGAVTPEGFRPRGASYPEFRDWRDRNRTLAGVVAWTSDAVAAAEEDGTGAELLTAERVTAGFLEVLGVEPALGRAFVPEEHEPDAQLTAVLSHDLWVRSLGAAPDAVGRPVRLNDRSVTVVGVAPPGFRGVGFDADLWLPLEPGNGSLENRGTRYLNVVGRLAPGRSVEAAREDLLAVAATLSVEHPDTHGDRTLELGGLQPALLGDAGRLLGVLLGAVACLLLLTGANVTNLFLVRAASRQREAVLRRALGARGAHVLGHLIASGALPVALGAAAAVGVALAGVRLLTRVLPADLLPPYVAVAVDGRILLFGLVSTAAAGLAASLAPAGRALGADPASGLRSGEPRAGRRRGRLQPVLVAGQVALAVVLVSATGLMGRSLAARLAVDPGFDAELALGVRVVLPATRYAADELAPAVRDAAAALEALPGVESVAWASSLPLRGGWNATFLLTEERPSEADRIRVYVARVGPGLFETLGVPLLAGRAPGTDDVDGAEPVAVVGDALARRAFGAAEPLGRRVSLGGPQGPWVTVVGVVADARFRDLTSDLVVGEDDPDVFVAWGQFPSRQVDFAVRTTGDPAALIPAVRATLSGSLPGVPLQQLAPLSDGIRSQLAGARFGSLLLALLGGLATLLAAVGVYGVMAFTVGLRRREIAIRMAMGAAAPTVRRMVLGGGLRLAAAGLVGGVAVALLVTRALGGLLFEVSAADPLAHAAAVLLIAGVALAATVLPAARATRVDPHETLSEE